MSFVVPATFTPWIRWPRFAGSSSVATTGIPGINGSFEAMRPMAKEPVSPAPTTSVRGRSHVRCEETNARPFWRIKRKINLMPPIKKISRKHDTTKTLMGSLVPIIHRNAAPPNVPSTVAPTICTTSSMLAYSQRLLYKRNAASTKTLMHAKMPRTK